MKVGNAGDYWVRGLCGLIEADWMRGLCGLRRIGRQEETHRVLFSAPGGPAENEVQGVYNL